MKIKISLLIMALGFFISAFGQKPSLELTFTAINNDVYVQLESIKVKNLNQGTDTVLFWPDTVLILDYQVEIAEINKGKVDFQVSQNYPNPVIDQTTLSLYMPEKGEVNMVITDILGRQVVNTNMVLEEGSHSFKFTPGSGEMFLFTARWNSNSSSIKILNTRNNSDCANLFEYIGINNSFTELKTIKNTQNLSFTLGEDLLCIGYANGLESGMIKSPESSETYVFQYATNIPCPGTPTVTYEGQIYNTIQICSQCWFKENLNFETGNSWWYNNSSANGDIYGRLYDFNTALTACPIGWHLPTHDEWKILEGVADTQFGIGSPEWDEQWLRGYDAGIRLRSITGWLQNTGTDAFGFSGLPGGKKEGSSFNHLNDTGYWWSDTDSSYKGRWAHVLYYNDDGITSYGFYEGRGLSVRCLKD